MSVVYVSEPGCSIGINGNRISIKNKDDMTRWIPIETVEGITLLGPSQLTTQCMEACLTHGITVTFLSKGGRYYGRLISTGHVNAALQRKQSELYHEDFSVNLAKRIMEAKLRNQRVVLRRYAASGNKNTKPQEQAISICEKKLEGCSSVSEIIGFEGQAAKAYFDGLSMCIEPEFTFHGRSRRPPMDEFNSMISLGYSILMNEIYSALEIHGLNPYFGFIHRDNENHPTLASDLMEEWRAALIDATAMSMINGHEIDKDEFIKNVDGPGCFLTKTALKKYLNKLEQKINTRVRYFDSVDASVSFRYGIDLQVESLVRAINQNDAGLYHPLVIR